MFSNKMTRPQLLVVVALSILVVISVISIISKKSSEGSLLQDFRQHKCFKTKPDTHNSTLELVHIVFRHGPRTPVDTYPNDPYINSSFEPIGWGHITNKGKENLYQLGTWLNTRYGDYLKPYYTPEKVYAQATASPRALMSLSTVLASFFPPKGGPMEWNKDLNWQPMPIFSEPLKQDSLLLVRTPCPRYFEALEEVMVLPEVLEELDAHKELLKNLTVLSGSPIANAEDVNSLYTTLIAEKEFGLTLPEWTKDYFPEKMRYLAEKSYIYSAYTTEMQKIKGGPFLKKMFREMEQKRSNILNPSDRKMFIYTGHDWTVANIFMALNIWKRQTPLFSIMAIFELHKSTNGIYYVEIFLRNDENGCVKQLEIPGCGFKCPLDQMIKLYDHVIPNEPYIERCKAKDINFVEPPLRQIDQISVGV